MDRSADVNRIILKGKIVEFEEFGLVVEYQEFFRTVKDENGIVYDVHNIVKQLPIDPNSITDIKIGHDVEFEIVTGMNGCWEFQYQTALIIST
jgi:hypothetical protein